MKKSFWSLSFVLIVMFIVQLAPVVGTASGRTVTVTSVTAQGGATVEVPIVLSGNTGICGATFSVHYDSRLTLTNVESGEAFSRLMFTEPGTYNANPVNLVWFGAKADTSNGTIAILTFTVPTGNGTYNIFIDYPEDEVLDGNLMPVNVSTVNGSIVVSDSQSGGNEEEDNNSEIEDGVPAVLVDSIIGEGSSVQVPIKIFNNPGICGATFSVQYDSRLTLTNVESGEALSKLMFTEPGSYSANPVNLVWFGTKADTTNGTIAVLTFTVPAGDGTYNISIDYPEDEVLDGSLMPVTLKKINGKIKVGSAQKKIAVNIGNKTATLTGGAKDNGTVFVAFYDSKGLISVHNYTSDVSTITVSAPAGATYAKAMWWESTATLIPVCKSQEIDLK